MFSANSREAMCGNCGENARAGGRLADWLAQRAVCLLMSGACRVQIGGPMKRHREAPKRSAPPSTITALKVHQWMPPWDKVNFDASEYQAKPVTKHFLLFTIRASFLKALTGVYRRSTKGGKARVLDPNVQRGHEEERSREIRDFVQFGSRSYEEQQCRSRDHP